MTGREPHAVVFPFPTQGHINPLMLLAKRLLDTGIMVTFVHTTRTFSMLQKSQQNMASHDHDVGRHGSSAHTKLYIEVLPDAVSTDDKSTPVSPSVVLFMSSIPLIRAHFESLIQRLRDDGRPPSCIISDSFLPWTQDVATHFGIPRIEFWSSTATVYSMGYCIPSLLSNGYLPVQPGVDLESSTIHLAPGVGPCRLADFFYDLTHYSVTSPIFQFLQAAFSRGKEAQRVLVHSMQHLEKDVIHALHKEGIPMDPIGPLLESGDGSTDKMKHKELNSMSLLTEDNACLEWLDMHPKASVIYVSFGSNVKITIEELQELALGLEDSQQPFVLVIRPDLIPKGTYQEALPNNFIERTQDRGRICSWVPQRAVLAHPSVGGFFSHCGWNSVLESLWMGVPLIGSPRESEQNTNLKCLLEWKAAIPVDTKQANVQIKRDLVAKAIKALMHEPEGELVRRSVVELKETVRFAIEKGQSRCNLQKLVDDIKSMALGESPRFLPTSLA